MAEVGTIIGIDLGGTKSAVALYDAGTWKVLRKENVATRAERGLRAVLHDLIARIGELRESSTLSVGIGIPGLIHQKQGRLIKAPNIPESENFSVKEFLTTLLDLPAVIDNDGNCFALAEATVGAGRGERVVIGITMGTGVGGGIVVDGKIFHGAHGYAGEIGHMLLKPGEPPFDADDRRGEVEQFLSGTALGKRCLEAKRPEDYLEGEVCEFLRPEVFEEVAWLATSLSHLLDPSVIVFGGSTGRALKPHLPAITEKLKQWMLPGTPLPRLAIAEREDAGTLGAALLAR